MSRLREGALLAAAAVVALADVPEGVEPWQPWAACAAGVAVVSLAFRRRSQPWGATASLAAIVLVAVGAQLVGAPGQFTLGHIVVVAWVLGAAARRCSPTVTLMLAGGAVITSIVAGALAADLAVGDIALITLIWSIAMAAGSALRWRHEANRALAEQVRTAERERIARELHDVVAHHVSAIALSAEGGRAAMPDQAGDDAAARAFVSIHEAARRTLDEMGALVGSLRSDDVAPLTLAALADSIEPAPGPTVDVRVAPGLDEPPAPVLNALHRIVQEAVTNARRHAIDATCIVVEVRLVGDEYQVVITDDGRASKNARLSTTGGGNGLVGLRERVDLLGGELHAGPDGDGGWRLDARLPLARSRR